MAKKTKLLFMFDPNTGIYLGPYEPTEGVETPDNITEVTPNDFEGDKIQIFKDGKWISVKETDYALAQDIRVKRNDVIALSDWTQLSDSVVDKKVWEEYRQALRDMPQQEGFPNTVKWPKPPKFEVVVKEVAPVETKGGKAEK